MIKYMKSGTKGEIALAVCNGEIGYDEDLGGEAPWVGYDPAAGKMYCAAKDGYDAFSVAYRIKAECGDEPVDESRGGAKAPQQYYYTNMEIGDFGTGSQDGDNVGKVIDLELPSCTYDGKSGYYDIATIAELEIDGMKCDIFYDNGEGGYDEFSEFYFSNPVRNLKLTLTEIPQNAEPERGMTKAPAPVYGWVLTFDEYNPR